MVSNVFMVGNVLILHNLSHLPFTQLTSPPLKFYFIFTAIVTIVLIVWVLNVVGDYTGALRITVRYFDSSSSVVASPCLLFTWDSLSMSV
ncbi:hypothetical protein L873DRAFT_1820172 [Choiromyces venosus 120613-1]|uniref:Uncharacterized protein n=1 Tax=Choiromyces venosus 120613-1 TaxID=1336337 RepID=A0A3N4J3E4_9PEZI|nr:hypothetical protein L873DRAFT_1820172 [Choiromyces venosus 120613-1]